MKLILCTIPEKEFQVYISRNPPPTGFKDSNLQKRVTIVLYSNVMNSFRLFVVMLFLLNGAWHEIFPILLYIHWLISEQ